MRSRRTPASRCSSRATTSSTPTSYRRSPLPDDRKASFPPIARADARLLVLGSLPGERSLAAGRYYAHPQNQFWRLMAGVVAVDLPRMPYDERLAALTAAGVALWDVVASARRAGSTDAAIREAEANDLAALVAGLPALRAIAFNGATAAAIGRQLIAGQGIALVTLPSSSPLHTIGAAAKQPAWHALAAFLPYAATSERQFGAVQQFSPPEP